MMLKCGQKIESLKLGRKSFRGMETRFVIISPTYNCDKFIEKHILSVNSQTYSNYLHIIVDDFSSDDTVSKAKEYNSETQGIVTKPVRLGCVNSHLLPFLVGIPLKDDDIIVHLDGDDWFKHDKVLENLEKVYSEKSPLVTYGNYESTDGTPSVCRPMVDTLFREKIFNGGWCFSHLRTFRKYLIDSIPWNYFFDSNGQPLTHAADTVIFLPIMELAISLEGENAVMFIDEVNVVYNRHGNNEDSGPEDRAKQFHCAKQSFHKKPLV